MDPAETQDERWIGHSVLQVSVPALEGWVRARTAEHDPAFVSNDPRFGHAHVTALGPFVDVLDEAVAGRVADVAAQVEPFSYRLARVATFPNGIVHLVPEPAEPFARLTALLVGEFPDHRPYGGQFAPDPHLTLDLVHGDVTEESTRARLEGLLPLEARAETLDLAWWESGRCHLVHRWPLGGSGSGAYDGRIGTPHGV
ncbi:2'-5' RNA ligase family protein [Ornithinimicrobium sp. W1665]|uniref:2'-5' RNA ligase family protein n=1 Tax=Ornithinimicrobium sp. W1665 TaxID=3416666 RepID=UPI003CF0138C